MSVITTTELPGATESVAPVAVASVRPTPSTGRVLRSLPAGVWTVLDWAILSAATAIFFYAFVAGNKSFGWVVGPWVSALAFCGCFTIAGLIFGLYERRTMLSGSRILTRVVLTLALATVLAYAVIFMVFYSVSTRWLGVWNGCVYLVLALPIRLLVHRFIAECRLNVLCVGTPASVRRLVTLVYHGGRANYRLVGHVVVEAERTPAEQRSRFVPAGGFENDRFFRYLCPCVGSLDDMADVVAKHRIDQVVVDTELASTAAVGKAVIDCLERGCRVTDQPTFTEKLLGEVPAEAINTQWFVLADVAPAGRYDVIKRLIDVASAAVGLLLTLPFWPLLILAIRLDSRGSALFSQQRVGLNGKVFTIYKFRTMRNDAEKHGAQWATQNDVRVTRFGRFLRKSRIDEIPQFWNILRGDMSIVGPRPERPEFVEQLAAQIPHYRQRHLIKPGLTGWAQINYRYGASVDDACRKLCFDLYYLKHRAPELDAAIIIRTMGTFISGAR